MQLSTLSSALEALLVFRLPRLAHAAGTEVGWRGGVPVGLVTATAELVPAYYDGWRPPIMLFAPIFGVPPPRHNKEWVAICGSVQDQWAFPSASRDRHGKDLNVDWTNAPLPSPPPIM